MVVDMLAATFSARNNDWMYPKFEQSEYVPDTCMRDDYVCGPTRLLKLKSAHQGDRSPRKPLPLGCS
jgi:hypothetical protein